jgi:hypothetical protein
MTRRSDYFTKVLQKVGGAFSIFKKEAGKGDDTDHPAAGPTARKAHSAD